MEKNYLLYLDDELSLEIYKWFVCTGEPDSISLFLQSLVDYQSSYVKHVLVKNLAYCQDWDFLSLDSGLAAAGGLDVPSIEMGALARFEFQALLTNTLTFNAVTNPNRTAPVPLRMMSQKRVYDYFQKCVRALDALGLIQFYSAPQESELIAVDF